MSLSFIMWAMQRFNGQNLAMCGKTIGTFRRNVLFWLKLMLKSRGYRVVDHRSDNLMEISRGKVTNYVYIFGGKEERSQDLIQGITLAGVFFDEVALMPESFVNEATGRCSVDGSKYWFNCNPDGPYHWFKTNWIDEVKKKNPIVLHFIMEDNLSLSEKIKARYRSMYSGVFYKRYILGLWAMAEGIIYDMFDIDKHVKKVVDFARVLIHGGRYVSVHYGTQNAMVFLLWNKGIEKKWYCTREYYYSGQDTGKQKSNSQYADELEKWLEETPVKAIILDLLVASFITELNNRGFKTMKANKDVEDGIRLVSTLLNTGKIAFSQSCINTINEFASYIWDPKAAERGEDKPIKQHDHAMDAVRHFCYAILNNKK